MILPDTSIWIDHLRHPDARLVRRLAAGNIAVHPFIIGEIALGSVRDRDVVIQSLRNLPEASCAEDEEVLEFIQRHRLFGLGIGYVDAHLLAAARMSPETRLWTRDRRLATIAEELGLAA